MKVFGTRALSGIVALVLLGFLRQTDAAQTGVRHATMPTFLERTRYDRFAPNAIRRARLAFLMSRHLSKSARVAAGRGVRPAATSYKVLNLNAIIADNGATIQPTALNDDGRIVGTTGTFLYDYVVPGYIINYGGSNDYLGYPGYGLGNFQYQFFPVAISNKGGTVAGFSDDQAYYNGIVYSYADSAVWTFNGATSTSTSLNFYLNYSQSDRTQITAISNQNVPVGGHYYWGQVRTPFAIANCPISNFIASAINDSGVIVGRSNTDRATALTLGGCPAYVPNAEPGYVVDSIAANGDMILQNGAQFELWAKGKVSSIPLPAGYAAASYYVDPIALNASDVVVGNVVEKSGEPVAAFEYANGKTVNLQSLFPANSGWVAGGVTGINDSGEVIGEGYLGGTLTPFALRR